MITIRHEQHFRTPAEVADWLAQQGYSGTLTARVNGCEIVLTFGAVSTVDDRNYAAPRQAAQRFMELVRAAADASAESYQGKL